MDVAQTAHGNMYASPVPPPMHALSPMARPPAPVYAPSLEHKIHEINRRLQERPDFNSQWWWDGFAMEFFDDTATMLISFCTPTDGEKHFTIGRAMIPQYFSSIFDGGVTEMHFTFSNCQQYLSHSGPVLECNNVLTTTQYLQPSFARVLVDSRMSLQCTFDERARILSWSQYLLRQKEYVPREMISIRVQESGSVESLLSNFTLLGINSCTLNFLNVSAISDSVRTDVDGNTPYQLLPNDRLSNWPASETDQVAPTCMMAHSMPTQVMNPAMAEFTQSPVLSTNTDSATSSERFCLTKSPKPAKKPKRLRKTATTKDTSITPPRKPSKTAPINNISSPITTPALAQPTLPVHQDVMIVGEPIMMGGDLGDKDERRITRLENSNSSDFLTSNHLHPSGHPVMNGGNGVRSAGLSLDLNNTEAYDEPSISAAFDALEQEVPPMHVPLA
ncbi:LIM domain-binding protein 2-like isoform X2 [Watersipora subatra]|uniref:LIM domain-binding protein 2-like isoform X2 n=1 Tax=Watersipora subatra TaxID=2589382 RepID=UPI00355C84D7